MPLVTSGSADLHGSTLNYIKDGGDFNRTNHAGRNLHFGIREHAMCGIMNGIAYDGIFRASGATFLVFSDYGRPSIRLAALSHLPTVYIFTHDSVGVGEDGPTHEPVETVAALRAIPASMSSSRRPRGDRWRFCCGFREDQRSYDAHSLSPESANAKRYPRGHAPRGRFEGGYIAKKESAALEFILLASGSELQHAMKAAAELGAGARVVSMPCFERFEAQTEDTRNPSCRNPAANASRSKPESPTLGSAMSASTAKQSPSTASASALPATSSWKNSASPPPMSSPQRKHSEQI
jgi:transketolase